MIKKYKRQVKNINGDLSKLSSKVSNMSKELKEAQHEVKKEVATQGVNVLLTSFFTAMATKQRERDINKAFDRHRREASQLSFEM